MEDCGTALAGGMAKAVMNVTQLKAITNLSCRLCYHRRGIWLLCRVVPRSNYLNFWLYSKIAFFLSFSLLFLVWIRSTLHPKHSSW